MNTEDFIRILREVEKQLLEISGCITLAQENEEMRRLAQQQAVGTIYGVRNLIDHLPSNEVTERSST
jgi:hypothetical protein